MTPREQSGRAGGDPPHQSQHRAERTAAGRHCAPPAPVPRLRSGGPAQELALLRKEVADVRRYTRGSFVLAAAAFLFAALAALFSAYTAYVTYTVVQALRDVANQLS